MLKKLLKYDFGAVIKLWSLGALAVLLLSAGGGLCMRILSSDRPFHGMINLVAGLGTFLSVLSVVAFSILTFILLAMRYYKNFFTDEGYLTFTLPVKLHTVINSKLIMVFVMLVLTGIVTSLSSTIMRAIGDEYFVENMKDFFAGLGSFFQLAEEAGMLGWAIVYVIEALLIMFFSSLFSVLFLGCCITFGSVVAKKAKVLASIGIYYGANWIFSVVTMIFMVFGMMAFGAWVDGANLSDQQIAQLVGLLLFGIIALLGMLSSLLYTLQYRLLDRKLNLP